MSEQKECCCGKVQYNLIFACSGAADVGAISDQAARKLSREKTAAMCCTAAVSAAVPEILERVANAAKIAVIDGCDKGCAGKIMSAAGFSEYGYVDVTALGMEKGNTAVSEENIAKAAAAAAQLLVL